MLDWRYRLPRLGPAHPLLMVRDASREPEFSAHPVYEEYPMLRSLAAYWIGNNDGKDYELQIWNPTSNFFDSSAMTGVIDRLATILRHVLIDQTPCKFAFSAAGLSESAAEPLSQELPRTRAP